MADNIDQIKREIESFAAETREELENFRLRFLARKGIISRLFDELKLMSRDERPAAGRKLNEIRKLAEERFDYLKSEIQKKSAQSAPETDYTLPARTKATGHENIILQTLGEFVRIFREIGFKVTEGPELEDEFHNFDALNTPEHHPARDLQDTFYILNKFNNKKYLLRTHTSPVQIRTMLANKPPVRIVCPGKVFRNETVTPKNYFMFHQVEGLCVDENVTMRDLKSVLSYFFRKFYGENTRTRFIPSFFPFTEPSAQVDITCFICRGAGCKTCKNSGWLEIGGCGMVDPNVFEAVGYDPEKYTGYAFGMGIERIAMMKYGIPDIRILYGNDIRFIEQF